MRFTGSSAAMSGKGKHYLFIDKLPLMDTVRQRYLKKQLIFTLKHCNFIAKFETVHFSKMVYFLPRNSCIPADSTCHKWDFHQRAVERKQIRFHRSVFKLNHKPMAAYILFKSTQMISRTLTVSSCSKCVIHTEYLFIKRQRTETV